MQFYAQIKEGRVINVIQGDPTGRFSPDIIWTPCDSDTQIGDIATEDTDVTFSKASLSLEEEISITLTAIKQIYRDKMSTVTREYDQHEIMTWPIQIEEAKRIVEGDLTDVIFLKALAERRGLNLQILAQRVLINNAGFRLITGNITGERQRLEDITKGATSLSRLNRVRKEVLAWKQNRSY